MAWGLPNNSLEASDLRLDISAWHHMSFSSVEDAEDAELESRYFRLCLSILIAQLNETIEVLYKWRDLDWMHRMHEGLLNEEWTLHTVAEIKGFSYMEMRDLYNEYKTDWILGDSTIDIWFTPQMKIYLESLNIDPIDCIEVCKNIVNEDRRLGIEERDIAELFLPQYEDIRNVKSAHGQNKNTDRKPTVRLQASTEAVSTSRSSESGYEASFLRRREGRREESRRQTDHADDADGESRDNGADNSEDIQTA